MGNRQPVTGRPESLGQAAVRALPRRHPPGVTGRIKSRVVPPGRPVTARPPATADQRLQAGNGTLG